MGILPLQFISGIDRIKLKLKGSELISVLNIEKGIKPSDKIDVEIKYASGDIKKSRLYAELILKMNWNIIKMVEYFSTF